MPYLILRVRRRTSASWLYIKIDRLEIPLVKAMRLSNVFQGTLIPVGLYGLMRFRSLLNMKGPARTSDRLINDDRYVNSNIFREELVWEVDTSIL